MAQYRITDTLLTRIANAVRRITGDSAKISPTSIATTLEDITINDENNLSKVGGLARVIPNGYYKNDITLELEKADFSISTKKNVSAETFNIIPTTSKAGFVTNEDFTSKILTYPFIGGDLEFTPSEQTQARSIADTFVDGAIIINPIPSNYTDTTDANASSSDILSGKTAYVDGQKVTGSMTFNTIRTGSSEPSNSVGEVGDLYFII